MKIIDLHVHMVSRTTDDYRAHAIRGFHAVSKATFRAGYDSLTGAGFLDYCNQWRVTGAASAARYGIAL